MVSTQRVVVEGRTQSVVVDVEDTESCSRGEDTESYYYLLLLYIYNAPCIRFKNLLKGANKVMLNNFK